MNKSKSILFLMLILLPIFLLAQEKKVITKNESSKEMKHLSKSITNGKATTRTMTFNADDVAMLMETSSILSDEDGSTIVKFMPPTQAIAKEYQNVDLKTNDKILFINGKKVKKLADFKNAYNEIEIGKEIELGIKRDDERFFVKFTKCDPTKLKGRVMMKTINTDQEK